MRQFEDKDKQDKDLGGKIVVTEAMIDKGTKALASYDLDQLTKGMGCDPELVRSILVAALS